MTEPLTLAGTAPPRARAIARSEGSHGDGPLEANSCEWPVFLTTDEVATLLRTSKKAIYVMAGRGQLPGVTRIGRRILFRTALLLEWLGHKSAPSPKG
jgi:excisionase family DNA binding protein